MIRWAVLASVMLVLTGCAETQIDEAPESLGEFKLRVNYAFADKAVQGPLSRDANPAEWTAAIERPSTKDWRAIKGRRSMTSGSVSKDSCSPLPVCRS